MQYSTRKLVKPWVILVFVLILLIFYNEVLIYYTGKWKKLECKEKGGGCTKVMLVADPQLIGLRDEMFHFLTPLSIWDSDLYLAKTYAIAYNYWQPDIVIFLGDLMDEGSKSTEVEFKYYLKRFLSIFKINNNISSGNVQHIFLPGDNDIGGEGLDKVSVEKIIRFERNFLQQSVVGYNNITFYKVNRMAKSIPEVTGRKDFYKTSQLRIALSHIPLMFVPSIFADKVLKTVQPQLIFSAHEHKSMIVSMDMVIQKDRQIIPVDQNENNVNQLTLGVNDVYEIIVPTCSYRMGTLKIGYGIASIENGEVQYTVLWSPSRFHQLINYGIIGVMLLIIGLCTCCKNCRFRPKRGYSPLNNNRHVLKT